MRYSRIAFVLFPVLLLIYSFATPQKNISRGGELPGTYNDLFAGSGACLMCHNSQLNQAGESVSIIADWRSSMMANAAKDPFWRAKVSHEGLVNPGHKEVLEDVCTRCHAPLGNKNAHYNGHPLYSISEMEGDPLALDGVQCTVCHQISSETLGDFSGTFEIGDQKRIFGPYQNPFTMPMIKNTGYTPEYTAHITDSRVCASCHTLLTNSVDNNGQPTGNEFVEQSVYQEWENSVYPAANVSCATCHVPRINDTVVISTMPPWLSGRTPFGLHHFQGANVFINSILKENSEELGITASDSQLDSTAARNLRSLQEHSLEIELLELDRSSDTLFVDLSMENISGHKFPTAYPSRRFFVELIVFDANNQIIFHSGALDEDYQLLNEDITYESHFNMINTEDQVQIYEMVMGDINHEVTTVLERANFQLKDNRIPPAGFTTSHFAYDTVPIVGNAEEDDDFNKLNSVEGSGKDILHFHIPVNGYQQALKIKVKLHYQTVTSKWLEDMFTYTSAEIDLFKEYFESANKEPVLIAADSIFSQAISIRESIEDELLIFPNPADSQITISSGEDAIREVVIYDNRGKIMDEVKYNGVSGETTVLQLNHPSGIYFIKVVTEKGMMVRKLVLR